MSADGCDAFFPESEAIKFLPPASLAILHKLKQEKEIDGADIDGLAKCPLVFAKLRVVIESC